MPEEQAVRGWSSFNQMEVHPPLCLSIGEGSIIFAEFDLRSALLSTTAWEIHGFDQATTTQLLDTIVSTHEP